MDLKLEIFVSVIKKIILLSIIIVVGKSDSATIDVQTGIDFWGVPGHQVRYLPNYSTPQEFHNTSEFFKGIVKHEFTDELSVDGKVRYSNVDGMYIDQASVKYRTEYVAFRAGVLPYRATWCEYLNYDSPWIKEPDAFCSYKMLADSVNSGSGVQLVSSISKFGWIFDGQIGYYDNMLYNQSKTQGAVYVKTGEYTYDKRYGISLNAVSATTGNQVRLSYITATQSINGQNPRDYNFDIIFAGLEINQIQDLSIKITATSYIGSQLNPKTSLTNYMATSLSGSVLYRLTESDQISLGINKVSNRTVYILSNYTQPLDVPTYSIAYRHDFNNNIYIKLQGMQSSSSYQQINKPMVKTNGVAGGIELGITF